MLIRLDVPPDSLLSWLYGGTLPIIWRVSPPKHARALAENATLPSKSKLHVTKLIGNFWALGNLA